MNQHPTPALPNKNVSESSSMSPSHQQIVSHRPASLPELRAAEEAVADALTAVLSDNTRRVYGAQWSIFKGWCHEMDLRSLSAEPLTVARYLGRPCQLRVQHRHPAPGHARHYQGTRVGGHESPCKDRGVRTSLKGWEEGWPGPSGRPALSPPTCWLSYGSPLRNPVPAAAAWRRPSKRLIAPSSTWPLWPCYGMGGCGAARRLH